MPRLSDLIEAKRDALAAARVELLLAEANLNGIIAALSVATHEFSHNDATTRAKLTVAVDRVNDARHALDEARYNALGEHLSGNRPLCTNNRDDMLDALITRLERNHCGLVESFNAPDPDYGTDIARAENALIERAQDRGVAIVNQLSASAFQQERAA